MNNNIPKKLILTFQRTCQISKKTVKKFWIIILRRDCQVRNNSLIKFNFKLTSCSKKLVEKVKFNNKVISI